jgi:hypothetical protein
MAQRNKITRFGSQFSKRPDLLDHWVELYNSYPWYKKIWVNIWNKYPVKEIRARRSR